ncbi:MAG: SH3 domain-containing protein [Clostridia bacterium]|nr:SH3 domain-containing protein [Clostridia bacterium]
MKTKEKRIKMIIYISFTLVVVFNLILFCYMYLPITKLYAKEVIAEQEEVKISKADKIDIYKIIDKNINSENVEQISRREEILEYVTQYRINKEIPKGISYVVQEGREGKQEIVTKTILDNYGNVLSEEIIATNIIKASFNKIIEIGEADYTSNYKVKIGDTVYVTSDVLGLMLEPDKESKKMTTLVQNDEVRILEINKNWYKVSFNNRVGWIKSECTNYINPNKNYQYDEKTKQQLISTLKFDMDINKPSGLTLEQFKKILSDKKDKNKVFENNAKYFYYIEKQYNINGVFVAAVGIHESAWGTSEIARQKNNLFGYGAYDSNPFNGAYHFSNYAESIDLIARVFVKYYLNPRETNIYGGEKAIGTFYNGTTLSAINKKYATDKKWAEAVYNHIKYLYNKL